MSNNNLRIAIDGGAATGKSTVSKLVAHKLGIRYINTGQMYRLFAFVAMQKDIVGNEVEIYNAIKDLEVSYDQSGNIVCESIDFSIEDLTTAEIAPITSKTSALPMVREVATIKQQQIGKENGVLMEGRDIGTVIMPDAPFKFFLKVDPVKAAHRRYLDHIASGDTEVKEEEILAYLIERNERDANREIAPLKPTEESIIIDTSDISAEEVANKIIEVVNG